MQQLHHLLWRAGFGPREASGIMDDRFNAQKSWALLWETSAAEPAPFKIVANISDDMQYAGGKAGKKSEMDAGARKDLRQKVQKMRREDIKALNLIWMDEMTEGKSQLREKMSLFWHGHFACRSINSYFQQQLLNTVRQNALGSFSDILRAVSKSPAMLQFLNNQQNKKAKPNENFAREVMELFTIGRGNYTEKDVKEAARAFTGWGFDNSGNFVFRQALHDQGQKTILGKTGYFNGDDVIDILLAQRATAASITRKVYRFFVNENADEARVTQLAKGFYDSGYSMERLLKDIFTANWFYDKANMGNRIKGPVELVVGLRRQLPLTLENKAIQLLFQRVLGQVLFYPPNVAGWPGGQNWIDSSSLMFRMRMPQMLAASEQVNIKLKNDDDNDMGQMQATGKGAKLIPNRYRANVTLNWGRLLLAYEKTPREQLFDKMAANILQAQKAPEKEVMEAFAKMDSRESYITSLTIQLMCTPEYQLC